MPDLGRNSPGILEIPDTQENIIKGTEARNSMDSRSHLGYRGLRLPLSLVASRWDIVFLQRESHTFNHVPLWVVKGKHILA